MISICIPTYEKPDYLKRLLDSIAIQTYKDYEIIISDDSKSELIKNVFDDYTKVFKNGLFYYYHNDSKSNNPVLNWNNAIKKAKGEYIKMMFDDDWFAYNYSLQCLATEIENTESDLVFCGTWQVSINKKYSRNITKDQFSLLTKDYRNLLYGNYIGAPSAVIFRNNNYFFDENLIWYVDFELYMRIIKKTMEFTSINYPLISIGINEKQVTNYVSNNKDLIRKEKKYIYLKHGVGILWKVKKYIYCKIKNN